MSFFDVVTGKQTNKLGLAGGVATDFYFEVARGSVKGHQGINRFGSNSDVGTDEALLWSLGGTLDVLTYSTTADIDTISSSDVSDTETILVLGLDANWLRVSQQVTLNGQNKVTLTTPLIRIHNIRNIGGNSLVGNVYLYVDGAITVGVPDDLTTVRAFIKIGDGQYLAAAYSVPDNTDGYIIFGKTSVASGKDLALKFYGRAFGQTFVVEHVVDINTENYDYFFKIPLRMPPKSDLEVRATTDVGTVEVSAAFDLIVVDRN